MEELLGGKRIGAVAISNKKETFGQPVFKLFESHAHSHDAGAHPPVVGDPVAEDGAAGGIHDEPDKGMDTADPDICLIGDKSFARFIVVMVHKGLYADGSRLAVVGNLLVGHPETIKVHECLGRLPQGKAEVDVQGEA